MIPRLPELLRELLGGVVVLLRDQLRQHLDDRHLGAEAAEDRRELAADDPAAEHDEPARHLRLGEQPGRVDAARRVEAGDRRPQRERPGRDDRRAELTSSPPSTAIVFASLNRPAPLTHSTPFALKSEATPLVICLTTPAFHSFAAPKSSFGSPTLTPSFAKVSSASLIANAVCTHAFVGMQPTRRHVPPSSGSFSMQAAFAPSCAARIAAGVSPRAASEDGDVTFHVYSLSLSLDPTAALRRRPVGRHS